VKRVRPPSDLGVSKSMNMLFRKASTGRLITCSQIIKVGEGINCQSETTVLCSSKYISKLRRLRPDHILSVSGSSLSDQFRLLHVSSPEQGPGTSRKHRVDKYSSKAHKFFDSILFSFGFEAKTEMANKYIDAIVKYVEPLLVHSASFFGGSDRLTLAEVSNRGPVTRFLDTKRLALNDDVTPRC
jgi:hypothetical protein